MAKNTGKRKNNNIVGSVMWFWIVVLVGTLLFKFTGILNVETPMGMLKALGILAAIYVVAQFLLNLRTKAS